jgi:hypothetical protein
LAPLFEEFGRAAVRTSVVSAPREVAVPRALLSFGAGVALVGVLVGLWLTTPISRFAPAPAPAPVPAPELAVPRPFSDCAGSALRGRSDADFKDGAETFELEALIIEMNQADQQDKSESYVFNILIHMYDRTFPALLTTFFLATERQIRPSFDHANSNCAIYSPSGGNFFIPSSSWSPCPGCFGAWCYHFLPSHLEGKLCSCWSPNYG